MQKFIIGENDANQRLDKYLTKMFPSLPQSMMYKAIRKKDIKLNKKRCEISSRLMAGDILELYIKRRIGIHRQGQDFASKLKSLPCDLPTRAFQSL